MELWPITKSRLIILLIYAGLLFLVAYQYPIIDHFNKPALAGGVPLLLLYILVLNSLYIIVTAIAVWYLIFKTKIGATKTIQRERQGSF